MRILTVTNMFPIHEHKYYGIFVKEQVDALSKNHPNLNIELFFINGFKSNIEYLKSIFLINFKLIKNNYDIIHIHFGLSGLFCLFNPFVNKPIITMLHSADIDIKKSNRLIVLLTKLVVLRSTHVLYLNEEMKRSIERLNKNITYLPCGIDTSFFVNNGILNCTDALTIGFPGNPMRPEKNYKLFEEIIKKLKENNVNVNVVIFHNKTRIEVLESLNQCDVIVMTSISEGSPQIIKEAMSCNIPIISSNVGDVMNLLKDVHNSFVIPDFILDHYVEKVELIINQPLSERKSNGRLRINQLGLDNKEISRKIYSIYKSQFNVENA